MKNIYLALTIVLLSNVASSQDSLSSQHIQNYISIGFTKATDLNSDIEKHITKTITEFRKAERKALRVLQKLDSLAFAKYKESSVIALDELESKLQGNLPSAFNSDLDTLKTSLKYLTSFVSDDKLKNLTESLDAVEKVENSFAKAEHLQEFISNQKRDLEKLLTKSGGQLKQLKQINKLAYYSKEKLNIFKETIKDKKKLEKQALELLTKSKHFKEFMRKNSTLAAMFKIPNSTEGSEDVIIQDLQTRSQVFSDLKDRFGSENLTVESIGQQMNNAKANLSSLQTKPLDKKGQKNVLGFTPNSQKNKRFLERLQYSADVQLNKSSRYFPRNADIALLVHYKTNDVFNIGIGTSSKLGFGHNWDQLRFSYEGVTLRTSLEYKVKNNFHLSGGYELTRTSNLIQLEGLNKSFRWYNTGLIGVSNKYRIGKKFSGSFQLYWDFLSYHRIPSTQPIIFRTGYSF